MQTLRSAAGFNNFYLGKVIRTRDTNGLHVTPGLVLGLSCIYRLREKQKIPIS